MLEMSYCTPPSVSRVLWPSLFDIMQYQYLQCGTYNHTKTTLVSSSISKLSIPGWIIICHNAKSLPEHCVTN